MPLVLYRSRLCVFIRTVGFEPTIYCFKDSCLTIRLCCNQQYVLLQLLAILLDDKYNTYNAFLLPDTQPMIRQRDNSLHRTSLLDSPCLRGSDSLATFSHTDWLVGFLDVGTTRYCSFALISFPPYGVPVSKQRFFPKTSFIFTPSDF